jgi:hypothetical protein
MNLVMPNLIYGILELFNEFYKNSSTTNEKDHANSDSTTSVPLTSQQVSTQPQNQPQIKKQESVRAASASIVGKKLQNEKECAKRDKKEKRKSSKSRKRSRSRGFFVF